MNFCRSCDAQLPENASFCRECGARVDSEKSFAASEISLGASSASQSFGDPSQRFSARAQGFEDHTQEFSERMQSHETQPQSSDIQAQSSDVQPQNHETQPQAIEYGSQQAAEYGSQYGSQYDSQYDSQSFAEHRQNHSEQSPPQTALQRHETSGTQQRAPQNNQNTQYPNQFEPYAQQQRMYQQYQGYRRQHHDELQILPEHERFRRLGGWMLLFVLVAIFGIFANLVFSVRILNQIVPIWSFLHLLPDEFRTAVRIELIGSVVMLSLIILQIAFVVSVFQRKPIFLRIEQISYIIACLANISFVVSANMAGMFNPGTEAFELVARPFAAIIGMIIMTAYYSLSVRVRVYMGSDEYITKALFSFKRSPLWPY